MTQANTNTNTHAAPKRPNFFILLGLKPDELWDEAKFKDVLREKRNEWSRVQNNNIGQKVLIAQRNLRLIPEIEAVMAHAQLRKVEADEARTQDAIKRQQRFEEFEKQIVALNAKDSIQEQEVENFIRDFQDIYTKDEIIKKITVPISAPASKAANQQLLEATLLKNIQELLSFINKSSLYDFLDLPDATGSQELSRAAEARYQREVQRIPKTEAHTELAGHAKRIFSDEAIRRQYDESLRRASLDRLLADLETMMNRMSIKEVQPGQVNLFLENAQRAGWSRDEAYAHLLEYAHAHRWFFTPIQVENHIRCRKCNTLNRPNRKFCAQCGLALSIDCPNCGEQVASEDRICDACHFEVGNRFLVEDRLKEVSQLISAKRFEQARDVQRALAALWKPSNPDALVKRINEQKHFIEQYIQKKQKEQKNVEEQFVTLTSSKRYYEAKSFLQKHEADITNAAQHRTAIDQNLTQAEILRRKLEHSQHSLNPDDHIARYLDIEDICRDLPGLDKLRIAPNPPTQVRAEVRGTIVSVTWQASTTSHVSYTIVRKDLARPNTAQDGLEIAKNVMGCAYDDNAATAVGIPLYYAVYSGYSDVKSDTGAVLAQPVMVTQSVRSVRVKTGNALIELQWDTPPHTSSVIVVRKEQTPPTSVSDGVRVGEYRPPQKKLTDTSIQNGQIYHYALYSQFKDHKGQFVLAEAEHVSATPDIPCQPPQPLEIKSTKKGQDYEVVIKWERPDRGRIEVMKTDSPFAKPYGTVMTEEEWIVYGTKLGQSQDQVVEMWTKPGSTYYTPTLIYQSTAYIGTSQHFVCVENLTNLEILNLGDRLQFSWRWPADCQEVLIAYSKIDWPGAGVADTVRERVSLAKYERLGGHWYLQGVADQEYFVGVTAIMLVEQTRTEAEELRRKVRLKSFLELTYEIRQSGLLHNKPALYITVNRLDLLPTLRLVARRDRLPLKKNDGDIIKQITPQRLSKLTFSVELDGGNYQRGTFVKLFLENDAMNDWVKINSPAKEKLRLS